MKLTIDMPQLAANGLSENWLFKHCGNRHWQELCGSVGTASADLCDDSQARLYPTFIAISAKYSSPLSHFEENGVLEDRVKLSNFGRSFFCSTVSIDGSDRRLTMDMITAFVVRVKDGLNDLRKSTPAASLAYDCPELQGPPRLLDLSKRLRKKELTSYEIAGHVIDLSKPSLGLLHQYDPSPYFDFNGANLLYYAAYPTICDTSERCLVIKHKLIDLPKDWALVSSTKARDVFYYRNLDIGQKMVARINQFDRIDNEVVIHTTLLGEDGLPIADLFTVKVLEPRS